jgi:hypothetical protein
VEIRDPIRQGNGKLFQCTFDRQSLVLLLRWCRCCILRDAAPIKRQLNEDGDRSGRESQKQRE